jgi:very-short-patch-repair endonuclease
VDLRIAELASQQWGVVSHVDLIVLGVTRRQIEHRLAQGRLVRIHPRVYAFGHARLTQQGRWLAAVRACGPGAALSHRSAAALWGLRGTPGGRIEVTVPRSGRHARRGVLLHTSRRLTPEDVAVVHGIPATTPARTIVDLADVEAPHRVRRAADQAERLNLHAPIVPIEGRRGIRSLVALEHERLGAQLTRSELEEAGLDVARQANLPRPEVNAMVEGTECDFVWRAQRLILEIDGFAFHRTLARFNDDREKALYLEARNWRVLRAAAAQLMARAPVVAALRVHLDPVSAG